MPLTYTQLAADNFTRANENPLNPANWTTAQNGNGAPAEPLAIVSDLCVCPTSASHANLGTALYTGLASLPNDQYVEFTINALTANGFVGVGLRSDITTDVGYEISMGPGPLGAPVLIEITNTGPSGDTLASITITVNSGDKLRLEAQGNSLIAKLNGVQIMSAVDSQFISGKTFLEMICSVNQNDVKVSSFAVGSISAGQPSLTRGGIRSEVRQYLMNVDVAQAGWTDDELNGYIDEGCFYVQQLTHSLWDYAIREVLGSQADYNLPDNVYQIIRTCFDRQFLPQTTEYELDRDTSSAWRGDPTGTPCRFYLKQFNQVSLYQIPRTSGNSYAASSEKGEMDSLTLPDNVTIDGSFSFVGELGCVTQLQNTSGSSINRFEPDPCNRFTNADYGIVVDFEDETQNLSFMYVAQTDTMTSDTQSPQFQETFHPAVVYYTLMRAFARDGEFQDMEVATAWYQAFLDWMDAALQANAKEFPTMVKSTEPYGIGNVLNGRLQAVGPPSQLIVIGTP